MSRFMRIALSVLFAGLVAGAVAAPASADISVRNGRASDLYVSSANPSGNQLERQFSGFWNPAVSKSAKYDASYRGDTAQVRKSLDTVMAMSRTMDFLSIAGRVVGAPRISGNRMTATVNALIAGYPAQNYTYYYVNDGGRWKFDWKQICTAMQCAGSPKWGY